MSVRSLQAFEVVITRKQRFVVAMNVVDSLEAQKELEQRMERLYSDDVETTEEVLAGKEWCGRARYKGDERTAEVVGCVDLGEVERDT